MWALLLLTMVLGSQKVVPCGGFSPVLKNSYNWKRRKRAMPRKDNQPFSILQVVKQVRNSEQDNTRFRLLHMNNTKQYMGRCYRGKLLRHASQDEDQHLKLVSEVPVSYTHLTLPTKA